MADLTAEDFISPKGDIDQSWFPGETPEKTTERVQAYLDQGYLKAAALSGDAENDAASHWTYYRAATAVYLRMNALPAGVDIPTGGSHQFFVTQIENMKQVAADHLAAFTALVVVPVVSQPLRLPNPIATPTVIIP